jgi:hypothetical protein
MSDLVSIDRRFRGPPDTANGGYAAGAVAAHVGGAAEITLRLPPPLETPLEVRRETGRITLTDGPRLVAEGTAGATEIAVRDPVDLAVAEESARGYIGFDGQTFMECFVCGPDRARGDGLRIFAGGVEGTDLVAAPWNTDRSLADAQGDVDPIYLWSALDCPTYFAGVRAYGPRRSLLGRIGGRIVGSAPCGEPLVVMAWPIGEEGRKTVSASAIYTGDGRLLAGAVATWITLKD